MAKENNAHFIDTDKMLDIKGQAECFYCSRVAKKENMEKVKKYGAIVYLCADCGGNNAKT